MTFSWDAMNPELFITSSCHAVQGPHSATGPGCQEVMCLSNGRPTASQIALHYFAWKLQKILCIHDDWIFMHVALDELVQFQQLFEFRLPGIEVVPSRKLEIFLEPEQRTNCLLAITNHECVLEVVEVLFKKDMKLTFNAVRHIVNEDEILAFKVLLQHLADGLVAGLRKSLQRFGTRGSRALPLGTLVEEC